MALDKESSLVVDLNDETVYKVAFSFLENADPALVNHIASCGVSLKEFFSLADDKLASALCLTSHSQLDINKRLAAVKMAEKEIRFMERHSIKAHFILDEDYPQRLVDIPNAPLCLYSLGDADLNNFHAISIVGTRHATPYGAGFVKQLVADLKAYEPTLSVVSGLAFGIDAVAHTSALENDAPTIGVLAHGLDMLYPAAHRDLAKRILKAGGALLTEYPSETRPYRNRFLQRNRIVALISEAVVVAESDIKGGAMSTAHTAFSYSRDVFALPGRLADQYSRGCNYLIRKQKAQLVTCAADMVEALGWTPAGIKVDARDRNLFPELDERQSRIYEFVRKSDSPQSIDSIHQHTAIPMSVLISILGEMEFDSIITRHPGNRFSPCI